MSEAHRNVFYYYRGPERGGDAAKNKALENNVTKPFLNTLDLCPRLQTPFVEWLKRRLQEKYPLRLGPPKIVDLCILEGPTTEEIHASNLKILLGIKKYNGQCKRGEGSKGRVDGTILGEGWLIAIESKLGDIYTRQLESEKELLRPGKGRVVDLVISWRDVHDFFREQGNRRYRTANNLLIDQFTSYLAAIGQLPFPGFKKEHFEFLGKPRTEKENRRQELKDLINNLGADLWDHGDGGGKLEGLLRGGWDWVRGLNRNNRLDYGELRFYLSSGTKEENQPYLSIQFEEDQIEVYACAATDRVLRALSKRLRRYGHRERLYKMTRAKNLAKCVAQIWHDDNKTLVGEVWPRFGDTDPPIRGITRSDTAKLAKFLDSERHRKGLSFAVVRCFSRDEVVRLRDGGKRVATIAETMRALLPVMHYMNG